MFSGRNKKIISTCWLKKVPCLELWIHDTGYIEWKKCLWTCTKCAVSHHPAHGQGLIICFPLKLKNPMILHTAKALIRLQMHRLIWAFPVHICPKMFFHGATHIIQGPVVQSVVSLTSSLRVISLTVLADSIHNILIFFQQKISAYLRITRCKF